MRICDSCKAEGDLSPVIAEVGAGAASPDNLLLDRVDLCRPCQDDLAVMAWRSLAIRAGQLRERKATPKGKARKAAKTAQAAQGGVAKARGGPGPQTAKEGASDAPGTAGAWAGPPRPDGDEDPF